MSRLGIIAAFPGELRPLVRGWKRLALRESRRGDTAWRGRIGRIECVAASAGMGAAAVSRACALAESAALDDGAGNGLADHSGKGLSGLVSLGWAGALSCGVHAGNAYPVAEVINGDTGERFTTGVSGGGTPLTLVTIGHVAQSPEKRKLAEKYRAVLVDMEAATVARLARDKGIPFYCFKAVSDAQGETLPDFGRYTNTEGKLRLPRLLGHMALRPRYWRSAVRVGKNSKSGAEAMARALEDFLNNEAHADNDRR